jgi:tripartite-type tricarboxylate transporter receptor subunit TctC
MGGLVICAVLALAVFAAPVLAQDWPARKAVTMVVPFAAGGPVDTIGRILASGLTETLGQQVIVENAGGAGGMTGASRVAKAAPDGYVFLLGGSATHAFIPNLYRKPLHDAVTDFAPVALVADQARVLITRKDLPPNTARAPRAITSAATASSLRNRRFPRVPGEYPDYAHAGGTIDVWVLLRRAQLIRLFLFYSRQTAGSL